MGVAKSLMDPKSENRHNTTDEKERSTLMFIEKLFEMLEPRMKKMVEDAYKQGAEDTIRRFAFVYDTVAQTAKADAYAEAGAIDIKEIDGEFNG